MLRNKIENKNLCEDPTENPHEPPTFKTVCHQWLEHKKKSCTPITIESYKLKVTRYLLKTPFADKPIDTIQGEEIEQWLNTLRAKCNINCIHGIRSILNNVFGYSIKMRWVGNNIAPMIKLQKPNVKHPEPFTIDEVETLLENIDPFYRNYQEVLFFTGMRPSEINTLIPSDIDLEKWIIWIGRYRATGQSHNTKRCRTHLMNERVFKAVSRQLELAKKQGSMNLFFNKQGKPINSSYYRKAVWKPLLVTYMNAERVLRL